MRLTLVRHATVLIDIAGTRILVDPAVDPAGSQPPVDGTPMPSTNPLVEEPAAASRLVAGVAAVLVTAAIRWYQVPPRAVVDARD